MGPTACLNLLYTCKNFIFQRVTRQFSTYSGCQWITFSFLHLQESKPSVNSLSGISSCSSPSPCQNNATCVDLGDSFRCECPDNYIGRTCNVYAGPCHLNRCHNGGTCLSNSPDSFKCQCLPGYEGEQCERGLCNLLQNFVLTH